MQLLPIGIQQVPQQELRMPALEVPHPEPQMSELERPAFSYSEQLEQECSRAIPFADTWLMELDSVAQQKQQLDNNYYAEIARLERHDEMERREIEKLHDVEHNHLFRNYEARIAKLDRRYDKEFDDLQDLFNEKGSLEELRPWFMNRHIVIQEELERKRNDFYQAHRRDIEDLKALTGERKEACTRHKEEESQTLTQKYQQDINDLAKRIENFLKDENPEVLQKGWGHVDQLLNRLIGMAQHKQEEIKKLNRELDQIAEKSKELMAAARVGEMELQQLQDLQKSSRTCMLDFESCQVQCRILTDKAKQVLALQLMIQKELQARGLPYKFAEAMDVD